MVCLVVAWGPHREMSIFSHKLHFFWPVPFYSWEKFLFFKPLLMKLLIVIYFLVFIFKVLQSCHIIHLLSSLMQAFDREAYFCYWLQCRIIYDRRNNKVHLYWLKWFIPLQPWEGEIKYKIKIIFLLEAFSYNLSLLSGAVNYLLNLTKHYNIWNLLPSETCSSTI